MNTVDKTYTFDLTDCVWNITFKCSIKNRLNEIKSNLFGSRDLTQAIDKFIQYRIVE